MRTPIKSIKEIEVGKLYTNNKGSEFKVLRIYSDNTVDIQFTDEMAYTYTTTLSSIRVGETRNPYLTTVKGVGHIGVGPYMSQFRFGATVEYKIWLNILIACYDAHTLNRNNRTVNHVICDEWRNFQVFAKWLVGLGYYDSSVYTINQSLLGGDSLVYSPETVCYIPISLRNHLGVKWKRGRDDLPQGVQWCKRTKKYNATISMGGAVHLGRHFKLADAAYAYKLAKEKYVKEVAELHRHELEPRVYEALMRWEHIETV